MSDLIQRLRAMSRHEHDDLSIGDEAADTIERLTAERDAARADERERCAKEAEHWQKISTTPGHACGQYIAAAIRASEGQ